MRTVFVIHAEDIYNEGSANIYRLTVCMCVHCRLLIRLINPLEPKYTRIQRTQGHNAHSTVRTRSLADFRPLLPCRHWCCLTNPKSRLIHSSFSPSTVSEVVLGRNCVTSSTFSLGLLKEPLSSQFGTFVNKIVSLKWQHYVERCS